MDSKEEYLEKLKSLGYLTQPKNYVNDVSLASIDMFVSKMKAFLDDILLEIKVLEEENNVPSLNKVDHLDLCDVSFKDSVQIRGFTVNNCYSDADSVSIPYADLKSEPLDLSNFKAKYLKIWLTQVIKGNVIGLGKEINRSYKR